jgi:hypothetical protein
VASYFGLRGRILNHILGRLWGLEVDGTDSGAYLTVAIGIGGVDIRVLLHIENGVTKKFLLRSHSVPELRMLHFTVPKVASLVWPTLLYYEEG